MISGSGHVVAITHVTPDGIPPPPPQAEPAQSVLAWTTAADFLLSDHGGSNGIYPQRWRVGLEGQVF